MNLLFSWSSGKDSALALYDIMTNEKIHLDGLWTTITAPKEMISFHGVTVNLLKKQAEALQLPLTITNLPDNCSNNQYEMIMKQSFERFILRGIEGIAYADLYVEEIRNYREQLLKKSGLMGVFPLWRNSTIDTAERFIESGFKAVITTVDHTKIDPIWIGRPFDHTFLSSLCDEVDPCGENGEFHTFVYDGPIFANAVSFSIEGMIDNDPYITARLQGE
ncbi:adenine nucleotide alpha hydrolase [Alkalihalobacillus sp. CinArs1]|uniref:adenine nucleotide alpha hydrolase n=1 Tax=Alkalihalobacillus sp. CinArs1 TaxID=2995314 RepID=UPI0022DD87B0|nr:adenine nucleotide alpha hydrolase [Alkalihalobacillus sp. CinArs1]